MNSYKKWQFLSLGLIGLTFSACNHYPVMKQVDNPIIHQPKYKTPTITQVDKLIPKACQDQRGLYQRVMSIKSRTSYLDKASAYNPVQHPNGLIKLDYNQDNKRDYIFIEREKSVTKQSKIRLVICESKQQTFQRKLPPVSIYESDLPDYQANYQTIQMKGGKLIIGDFRHEHNWGSDQAIHTYRYNKNLQDFELLKYEVTSTSGDALRPDTDEVYFLTTQRYIKRSTCGALETDCKQLPVNIGRIILPKQKVTLFKPIKTFTHLIPD